MAKSGRKPAGTTAMPATAKRQALVDAAFQTLREEGFARASARAIAGRVGCNSALVFYYFGSVNNLLVEALATSSRAQLDKYEEALADVTQLDVLITVVQQRFRDDQASGHVKVLAELVGAGSADDELRRAVLAHVAPWKELTEQTLERVLAANGLGGLVPVDQMAFVVVSLFLGMELLADLPDDAALVDACFGSAQRLAALLGAALPAGATDEAVGHGAPS